jgi:glucokinase
MMHNQRFVIVSGLPGSGKSTLARRLAPALDLLLIDKDDILERLYETRGTGDAEWRRSLSRESDAILEGEVKASAGAVIASFWRQPGMAAESGTPTTWLSALNGPIVEVCCVCPPAVATSRFLQRQRHPGHLDHEQTYRTLFTQLETLARLAPLDVGERIDVDTTIEPNIDELVGRIQAAFARCLNSRAND